MNNNTAQLRAEPHSTIGAVIARDSGVIIDRWARRVVDEDSSAKRVHHDVLLDHLPAFLWELGRGLSETETPDSFRHCRPASIHGDQRWESGWSIEEVVRDYLLLRVIIIEHLDEVVRRPLTTREIMALGVFIDDAIGSSVAAFLNCQQSVPPAGGTKTTPESPGTSDLFGILGVLGHELRNPLAPLGTALEVLKLSGTDPSVIEQTRLLMERQFKVMTRLVDDLLDLPRLVRGKMKLMARRLDLAQLLRDVVEDRRGAFEGSGVRLSLSIPDNPVWTTGDGLRLTQVVGNLLGNALKFTNRGGEVVVTLTPDPTQLTASISVRDTGIGIDPSIQAKIFEAFVQADRAVERSRGGLGLGLALVKGIIELHGGTVCAFSQGSGTGSEFIVQLPLVHLNPADGEVQEPVSEKSAGRRVLVIEDNEDSADSLKTYLEILGHEVMVAHSGPEGLALAASSPPDVITCDIGLPGMNGYVVCAELRKLPTLSSTTFIALSGHAPDPGNDDEYKGIFDLHLLKPVNPERMAQVISEAPTLPR